jgi:hypothetical protein
MLRCKHGLERREDKKNAAAKPKPGPVAVNNQDWSQEQSSFADAALDCAIAIKPSSEQCVHARLHRL